jgi:hypothetical protein
VRVCVCVGVYVCVCQGVPLFHVAEPTRTACYVCELPCVCACVRSCVFLCVYVPVRVHVKAYACPCPAFH